MSLLDRFRTPSAAHEALAVARRAEDRTASVMARVRAQDARQTALIALAMSLHADARTVALEGRIAALEGRLDALDGGQA